MADLKRWGQGEITRIRLEMDRLFDELCFDLDLPAMICRMSGDIELWEEGDTLVARMELHGVAPGDVSVVVLERLLVITARMVETVGGRSRSRAFRKEIKLPCAIRTEEAQVEFAQGVLVIRLPKCASQYVQIVRLIKK
ncbi:MAG: Hsp20/alpha crystallin family protein [Pseudodesulfovibrio sp.]|uniref:Heat shock protein Hsp20 n=1 Tax=Pseudodesulfovibrio aespoeensis (strain ATCC 700646 / DSM 10631 / Aspo-2) TaxID=643562 RepID=E6VYE9_PSEA9|nr:MULTISPECIES: Hsp20/alpha crystallin family protein [Pseudodesulfovibrio]MBU4378495.1 Hsp20/alpha crystallin family protein [Pseudomonadota bacterium]ADU62712.1 heat shock protein Hsp20 [Pseudodesulfovibrio aespoeensis Aspo-2]MBU4476296.1 Hsp20/alpha crystallin family protein [Pseudomonadota bacterium]MBU4515648.1 Hsp20/alpha crystallin family protein [Pseudomonadota bacterium]MBU4523409.1 Hsp20/alpha crystallin family protein [Pseudomonadota bacterium]